MAYIENIVIGIPIVDPKDMFSSAVPCWKCSDISISARR